LKKKEDEERKKALEEQERIDNDPILKAKLKKEQEDRDKESDLRVATDLFGDEDNEDHQYEKKIEPKKSSLDNKSKEMEEIKLSSSDDWKKYTDLITKTITSQTKDVKEDNKHILTFLNNLIRNLNIRLKLDDVNELKKTMTTICNDKIKSSKDPKELKKKNKAAAKPKLQRGGGDDDFSDFI